MKFGDRYFSVPPNFPNKWRICNEN
jgi:hypothetical protein